MTFAVAALIQRPGGKLDHVLWNLTADSADEAEALAMRAAVRRGELRSLLVKASS